MNDSLREVSRFLFPRLNCREFLSDDLYRASIAALIVEGVGGFVLFDGDVTDCARTTAALRLLEGERPLLLAADCEFGLTMRFDGGTEFPGAWALGSADDPDLTYRVALRIACEMRAVGLDWNFAPVLDVNTNPENPIINLRAFGEEPEQVALHGVAFFRGLRDGGVLSCGKHFPGHGDTSVDSHIGLPVLPFDPERLNRVELLPFRRAIKAGIPAVMSAHLAVPSLDPSGAPASLSEPVVSGLLRGDLGFDGVVVTDALDMGAIVSGYGTGEGVVRAFLAGNDVLEIPDDPLAAIEGLRRGVKEGRISAERIGQSARRLDGLLLWRAERSAAGSSAAAIEHLREESENVAAEAARKALNVRSAILSSPSSVAVSSLAQSDSGASPGEPALLSLIIRDETAAFAAERWRGMMRNRFGVESAEVEVGLQSASLSEMLRELAAHEEETHKKEAKKRLIVAVMIRPRGGAGSVGLGESEQELRDLLRDPTSVLVNFGNPYLLRDTDVGLRIDAFSSAAPSLVAAMEAL